MKNSSQTISIPSQEAIPIQTKGPHLYFGCKLPKLYLFNVIVPCSVLMLAVP